MGISPVLNQFANSGGLSGSVAYPNNNAAGNLLVCVVRCLVTDTVADTNNGSWTRAAYQATSDTIGVGIFYYANCKSGANTVNTTASIARQVVIGEYSGLALTSVLGNTNAATGTGNTVSSGSVSTSPNANTLLIGGVSNETLNGQVFTPTGGFGNETNANAGGNTFLCDQIVSSVNSYTFGGSYSGAVALWAAAAAVFIGEPTCATPVISPAAGAYDGSVNVTITCSTPGNSIYYTTDGSTPTSGSTPYTPFTVDSSLTVKAIAIASGYVNSAVASAAYTLTYTISGSAGVAGATVTYAGTTSGSVVADGSGNYAISGLPNLWTGTVTPSKTGYTFSPANSSQTINSGDNTGVNFTATSSGGGASGWLNAQHDFANKRGLRG
jgi:hypothetical protein